MKIVSIREQISQLSKLVDTGELYTWENCFVSEICDKTKEGDVTDELKIGEITSIKRIYRNHFGRY